MHAEAALKNVIEGCWALSKDEKLHENKYLENNTPVLL
jgi:hypothetical protein